MPNTLMSRPISPRTARTESGPPPGTAHSRATAELYSTCAGSPIDGSPSVRPVCPAPVIVAGVGTGRALIAASSSAVTWAIRAVSSSSWPSSIRASWAWWSVNRPCRARSRAVRRQRARPWASSARTLGLRSPGDQRLDHRPAGHPEHVGEHRRDLDQSVLEQLLDPLLDPGAVLDQVEPGPGQIPHADASARQAPATGTPSTARPACQPHRVELVGLRATRHVLHLRGVDQPHRQPGRLEQIVERAPVVRGGLQHHPRRPARSADDHPARPAPRWSPRPPRPWSPAGPGSSRAAPAGTPSRWPWPHRSPRPAPRSVRAHRPAPRPAAASPCPPPRAVGSPGGAARGDRWDSQNLTGVLVATVRNPSRAPAPD